MLRVLSLVFAGVIVVGCTAVPPQVIDVTPPPVTTRAPQTPTPTATRAAAQITPSPAASLTASDLRLYTGLFQSVLREVFDVHIVGFGQVEVTEERVFIWVDSTSTEDVMKEQMYRLYDEIAGLTPDDWSPDVVIRMGRNYNNDWLQSTTSSSSDVYSQIDEQLEWEFFSVFERQGQTF